MVARRSTGFAQRGFGVLTTNGNYRAARSGGRMPATIAKICQLALPEVIEELTLAMFHAEREAEGRTARIPKPHVSY